MICFNFLILGTQKLIQGGRMNRIKFLSKGLSSLRTTGAVTRSSRFLCQAMADSIDYSTAKVLVELGAGDGVITKHILERMPADAKLLVFEVQASFCEILRKIDDDRLVIIEDSAEHIGKYLKEHGYEKADGIISAIPFVILPKPLVYDIVRACKANLLENSFFVQFHYSKILKSVYEEVFDEVKVKFVPRNMPPAFVFRCK